MRYLTHHVQAQKHINLIGIRHTASLKINIHLLITRQTYTPNDDNSEKCAKIWFCLRAPNIYLISNINFQKLITKFPPLSLCVCVLLHYGQTTSSVAYAASIGLFDKLNLLAAGYVNTSNRYFSLVPLVSIYVQIDKMVQAGHTLLLYSHCFLLFLVCHSRTHTHTKMWRSMVNFKHFFSASIFSYSEYVSIADFQIRQITLKIKVSGFGAVERRWKKKLVSLFTLFGKFEGRKKTFLSVSSVT